MTCEYRLDAFNEAAAAPARDLASLHEALLPESPIPLLGDRFMQQFYYSVLPREALIRGAVAYIDGKPAGFIVVTDDAAGFMRKGLRRHWLRVAWLVGTSVLLAPKRAAYVWEALKVMRASGAADEPATGAGQILSFGVLAPYRDLRFVRRTGLKIGIDLLRMGTAELRRRGVREIRAAVHRDNLEAQLFYRGQGWALRRKGLPGWRVPAVEMTLRVDDAQAS